MPIVMDTVEYAVGGWIGFTFLVGQAIHGPVNFTNIVIVPIVTIFITFLVLNILKIILHILVWVLSQMFRPDIFLFAFTIFMVGLLMFVIHSTVVLIQIPDVD